MKTVINIALLLLMAIQSHAAGIVINSDTRIITQNGTSIVVSEGDWVNNSSFGLGGNGRVVMSGSNPQVIGGSQPSLFPVLEINNTSGVSITSDVTVQDNLTFTSGTLALGSNNLLLKSSASIIGAAAGKYVVASGSGQLRKEFGGTGSFTFPVGDTTVYTPAIATFSSGTFGAGNYAGVRVTKAKHPSITSSDYLNRYWSFSASGITAFTSNLSTTFVPGDVIGTEASLNAVHFNPSLNYGPPALPSLHSIAISGQSVLGDLSAMASNIAPGAPYNIEVRPATDAGKLTLTWNTPTDPLLSHVHVYRSAISGQLGVLAGDNISTVSFVDTGLAANSAYYYLVRTVNPAGIESSNTLQISGTTLASLTLPPNVANLTIADTTQGGELLLSWSNPGSPTFTGVTIYRSTDGSLGSQIAAGLLTTYRDTGLTNNVTYHYTVVSNDNTGQQSSGVTGSQIPTSIAPPLPVTELKATLLAGGQVLLSWSRSASGDVAGYYIFGDAGTGIIDYGTPLGNVSHPAVSWTSNTLNAATAYRFAVRAKNSDGLTETNTDRVIGIKTVADPVPVTSVIPDAPKTGETVKGSSVSVSAVLNSGSASNITDVTFQYRSAADGNWVDIATDSTAPYGVSWDTSSLLAGDYHLRAVATGTNTLSADENIFITVIVSPSAVVTEQQISGSKQRIQSVLPTAPVEVVMTGGDGNGTMRVAFQEGSIITGGTVTIKDLKPYTEAPPVPASYLNSQVFRSISIGGGMQLEDKTTTVELPYKDDNDDGIVDGTTIRAADLKVCHYSNSAWECLDSYLDRVNKRIRAHTPGFSDFGLLVPPIPVGAGWNFISVPLTPTNNSVAAVFGTATTYTNYTTRWDAITQAWATATTVLPGTGYLVWGTGVSGAKISVTGTETPDAPQAIALRKGWNLIGHPFRYRVSIADLTVTYNGSTVSMQEAQVNGWVAATAYKYLGGSYQYQTATNGGTLEPWVAYWILSDLPCTLTIPNIQAQ